MSIVPKTNKAGFTLIELLIVIVLIGILATIGFGYFVATQQKVRDSERKNDLRQIANALEVFYTDHGSYPPPAGAVSPRILGCPYDTVNLADSGPCIWGDDVFEDDLGHVYFNPIPADPGGGHYYYKSVSADNYSSFQLFSTLENENDPAYLESSEIPGYPFCGTGGCHFSVTSPNVTPATDLNSL